MKFGDDIESIRLEALECLSPKQREVWNLVMVRGLSIAKAAKALSPSKAAVQDRLNLAVQKMTQEMERIKSERGITNGK